MYLHCKELILETMAYNKMEKQKVYIVVLNMTMEISTFEISNMNY